MIFRADRVQDVGLLTITFAVAFENGRAKRIDRGRHVHVVAILLQPPQRVVKRLEHRQIRCGADRPSIRRKAVKHDADPPLGGRKLAQNDLACHTRGQPLAALGIGHHVAIAARGGPAAKNHGVRCAVDLGQGHHHRRFDRRQTARGSAPGFEGLELDRVRRMVGHVERAQRVLCGGSIVVGRATDEAEPGQGHQGINARAVLVPEEAVDRGAGIQSRREGGDNAQALCFERLDHAVIMGGVSGQHVGAHNKQADRTRVAFAGQTGGIG